MGEEGEVERGGGEGVYRASCERGVPAALLTRPAEAGRGAGGFRRAACSCFSTAVWRTWYQPGPKVELLPAAALPGRCLCNHIPIIFITALLVLRCSDTSKGACHMPSTACTAVLARLSRIADKLEQGGQHPRPSPSSVPTG